MKHHVERAIIIGFALTLLFMASISAAAYWITARVESATVERARTGQIRLDLATLLSQLQDAELAARGYVITGDKNYLASYSTTVSGISQSMTDLRQLTADETFDQQKLDQLAPLIQARLADIQQTIDLYSSQGFVTASSLVRAGQGESLMDQIRQTIGALQAAENTEYAQRDAALSGEMRSVQKAMLLVSLAAVAVMAVAGFIIRRGLIERGQAQKRILHLNRLYATLSQINQTIVRVREPQALFEEICRVAIEHGQFRMAWIGLMDETDGLVKPAASKGAQGYFENLIISYQDESLGRGPVGTAIRENHSVIIQDTRFNPSREAWRERILRHGFLSLGVVPIRQTGRVIGALAVYSAEAHAFDLEDEKLLDEIGGDISFALDAIKSEDAYQTLVEHSIQGFIIMQAGRFVFANQAASVMLGYEADELLALSPEQIAVAIHPDDRAAALERIRARQAGEPAPSQYEYRILRKNGETRWLEQSATLIEYQGRPAIQLTAIDITERKQAQEAIVRSESRYRALVEQLPLVIYSNSTDQPVSTLYVSPQIEALTGYSAQECLANPKLWETILHPADREAATAEVAQMYLTGKPFDMEYRMISRAGRVFWVRDQNMLIRDSDGGPQYWQGFIIDITASKQSEEKIKQQLKRITALNQIDLAIASSFDLRNTLDSVASNAITQLGVDAAAVLVMNTSLQLLEYKAGQGFRTSAIKAARVRLGEGHAGRIAVERRMLHISESEGHLDNSLLTKDLAGQDFVSYYGVPLIVKGRVNGVLEVFHRLPLNPDADWLNFLNTLAGQAAIAIDNASLFENLQVSNTELTMAYDATIQGWSRALDLRDKETEGHTLRVTDMAVKLAAAFGMNNEALAQIRRGALLHDIGKMGVPDNILLKPGELTDEEWVAMKKHPTFAYEMLAPIGFLKGSLDIPYCHHEKWNGTGYPRGLSGEQIPLAARIFAVVDVWDALTSERVYRKAWPNEKALDYVKSRAGIDFDPRVVQVCLESGVLVRENPK